MEIYVLWFNHRHDDGNDDDMMLGVFSTREKAQQAVAFLRDKPGFKDHTDKFEILAGEMDHFGMKEGFVTVYPDDE